MLTNTNFYHQNFNFIKIIMSSHQVSNKNPIPNLPQEAQKTNPKIHKYVKLGYHYLVLNSIYLLLILFVARLKNLIISKFTTMSYVTLVLVSLGIIYYIYRANKPVYLVDFACCKPDPSFRTSKATCMDRIVKCGTYSEENVEFQRKLFERSGVGDETHVPSCMLEVPPKRSLYVARKEIEYLLFGAIDKLFAKKLEVGIKEIGIVIVNCSMFNPLPSLCDMVIHRYKFRGDVVAYNISGMGCSAGIISVDLAKNLLKVHPNTYALVVSVEGLTQNWYPGNDRSMLISNCLFRMGGAALLMSNKPTDRRRSKYKLKHVVRTHRGANDSSYKCAYQQEDELRNSGVALSKDLMFMAGEALKTNISTLGPFVLPMSEILLFLIILIGKKAFLMRNIKPYLPDFKLAFEHFCVHAGGRAVLDELENKLKLSEWHMEASRMTLYRYGNTSSSSLWYELAYHEAKGRIKKGDRIWQVGFGSGFKCNSAVWCALRNVHLDHEINNPWKDEIHNFPINVPKVSHIIM